MHKSVDQDSGGMAQMAAKKMERRERCVLSLDGVLYIFSYVTTQTKMNIARGHSRHVYK
jgi:hypothetical protein